MTTSPVLAQRPGIVVDSTERTQAGITTYFNDLEGLSWQTDGTTPILHPRSSAF